MLGTFASRGVARDLHRREVAAPGSAKTSVGNPPGVHHGRASELQPRAHSAVVAHGRLERGYGLSFGGIPRSARSGSAQPERDRGVPDRDRAVAIVQ